ncbi:MAG: hypothetical protein U1E65_32155 [Myxococcota bacterium]
MRRWLALVLIAAGCGTSGGQDAGAELPGVELGVDAAPGVDVRGLPDVSLVVEHDGGPPASCAQSCDCPQGLACIGGVCRAGSAAVYCCTNPGCPGGHDCLGEADQPGQCPSAPDAGADAGPHDIGAGALGAACQSDPECGRGLSCSAQTEAPFLWGGYCTVVDCLPSCPAQSSCVGFGPGNPSLCLADCLTDRDCRDDAYCLGLASGLQVCFPDCRDDLFDCSPRTGATYCDRGTGRCEVTPGQNAAAAVGAACLDNRDCAPGDVCMGQVGWNLPGGMCTHVCSGLAEATPCGPNDACQDFAGVGLCFARCQNGACPGRPSAICTALDPSWIEPGCVPQ